MKHSFVWILFVILAHVSATCIVNSTNSIKGIRNSGGTCFANAVAQCLFRINSVKEFVLNSERPEISGLKNLFKSLDESSIETPASSSESNFIPEKFVRGEQGDAEEFYTAWLDILERNEFKDLHSELFLQLDLTRIRENGMIENLTDKWSSIRVTFPQIKSDGPIRIEELFSRPEGPFGEEQLGESLRQFYRIFRLPKILLLNFIRTGFDANFNSVKIETPVILPETMDFSPYLSESSSQLSHKTSKYRLKMFVTHTGANIQSGHYFAHARNSISQNIWSRLDDENVQTVTTEQALEAVKHASLVFYEQTIE